MKYLVNQTDVFRCDNEREAEDFVKTLKSDYSFEITSYSMEKKEQKVKGEVVDDWVRLTVKKKYNDEKEPFTPYHEDYVSNDKEEEVEEF